MAINVKRLLKLAAFLETVKPLQFEMRDFGHIRECGFAGCALGWAAYAKLFEGFRRVPVDVDYMRFELHGKPIDGFSAAKKVFSIYCSDAVDLFTENKKDEKPKQVATRIRQFVKANSAERRP